MTNNCCQKQHCTTWLLPPERGVNSVCHLRHSEIGRRIDLPVKNTGQLCRYTASRINVAHHVLKKFLCCCHGPTASFPMLGRPRGRVCTVRAQRAQHAHDRKNWGVLLQLAIFLPIQTILQPHNVGQPDVSPHPQHKRCQCTQAKQRHMQKKARIKFVPNSKCERRTPLRLAYIQDMHHSTWCPHPHPPFSDVQPHGDTSCFAMGFLCGRLMRRTNQNYLHLQ